MLKYFAAAVCAVALAACGGTKKYEEAVVVQPDYKLTTTAVGSGLTAEAGDLVTFNYAGYLYDSTKADFKGKLIQSSYVLGSTYTATVGVGAMLTGWDQALLGMQPGGKRTTILPANLAYGATEIAASTVKGTDFAAIPANSPLVFDFELVSVSKKVTIPSVTPPTVTTITEVQLGTGDATVAKGNTVTVRYTGWLYDGTRANLRGTQFDTNVSSTDPLTVAVGAAAGATNSVITGFSDGLVGMKVGGKRTVIIPPDQGYGATAQTSIPANSTLVFDIELIAIK